MYLIVQKNEKERHRSFFFEAANSRGKQVSPSLKNFLWEPFRNSFDALAYLAQRKSWEHALPFDSKQSFFVNSENEPSLKLSAQGEHSRQACSFSRL